MMVPDTLVRLRLRKQRRIAVFVLFCMTCWALVLAGVGGLLMFLGDDWLGVYRIVKVRGRLDEKCVHAALKRTPRVKSYKQLRSTDANIAERMLFEFDADYVRVCNEYELKCRHRLTGDLAVEYVKNNATVIHMTSQRPTKNMSRNEYSARDNLLGDILSALRAECHDIKEVLQDRSG